MKKWIIASFLLVSFLSAQTQTNMTYTVNAKATFEPAVQNVKLSTGVRLQYVEHGSPAWCFANVWM